MDLVQLDVLRLNLRTLHLPKQTLQQRPVAQLAGHRQTCKAATSSNVQPEHEQPHMQQHNTIQTPHANPTRANTQHVQQQTHHAKQDMQTKHASHMQTTTLSNTINAQTTMQQ